MTVYCTGLNILSNPFSLECQEQYVKVIHSFINSTQSAYLVYENSCILSSVEVIKV